MHAKRRFKVMSSTLLVVRHVAAKVRNELYCCSNICICTECRLYRTNERIIAFVGKYERA